MRTLLLTLFLLLFGPAMAEVARPLVAPTAVPADVLAQMQRSDDHPREALTQIQLQADNARAAGDDTARFWWSVAAARVLARLEQHSQATQNAETAAALLTRSTAALETQRLWLQMAQLDAQAGVSDRAGLLPQVTQLRVRAETLGEVRLACEARGLEQWVLLDLRSDDEAWLMAEAVERCGQALNLPEQTASGQLTFAILARKRLADGSTGLQPQRHLALALDTLGQRPARFMRSLIAWEAGIVLRLQKELEPALVQLQQARALSQELDDSAGVAAANLEIAAVLLALDRPQPMLPLLDEAARLLAAGGEGDLAYRMPRVTELKIEALVRLASPQLPAVLEQAQRWAADVNAGSRTDLQHAMAKAYAAIGRPVAAYEMLRTAIQTEQQARTLARDTQLQRLQSRYDNVRRDAENAELRLRSETAKLQLEAETGRRHTLTAGLVALAALALVGFTFGGRELARRRRMAALALRDELTGQPNRRAVRAYAQEQLAQSHRLGLPFTLAVIDFDHFKQVNDRFGHPAGDAVLRSFAQAAAGVLRGQDRLGRWGGEEWLLVMPGTRLAEVEAVFERLRERFAITLVPGVPVDARCSFSMGAAELDARAQDLDSLVAAADAALYRAKQAGRDRLAVAPRAEAA
jgi:diguanylate cyclase (GGDEF)-like protein